MASTAILQRGRSERYWPPDDTEESVVGTDHHQMTIMNIRFAINELARAAAVGPNDPPPWQALSQTVLLGLRRPNGTLIKVLPDVYVYRKAIAQNRGSVSLRHDGPPVLAIEVASESTFEADLNLRNGKGWSYEHAGVREYVVLDPGGELIPTRLLAWRLEHGTYVPCAPHGGEPWWSTEIPIGLAIEGDMVGVYDREHRRQLREGEMLAALTKRDEELARKDEEAVRKDEEIVALRRRLAQLGDG
jgi:Uma2 family endonuclease